MILATARYTYNPAMLNSGKQAREKAKQEVLSKAPQAKYFRFWEESPVMFLKRVGRVDASDTPLELPEASAWMEAA